jgi:hypothetical protein
LLATRSDDEFPRPSFLAISASQVDMFPKVLRDSVSVKVPSEHRAVDASRRTREMARWSLEAETRLLGLVKSRMKAERKHTQGRARYGDSIPGTLPLSTTEAVRPRASPPWVHVPSRP